MRLVPLILITTSLLAGPAAFASAHQNKNKPKHAKAMKSARGKKATAVVPAVSAPIEPAPPAPALPSPALPSNAGADESSAPTPTPVGETIPADGSIPVTDGADLVTEPAPARWRVDFGAGFDARWRRGVNPEFGTFTGAGQLFTTVRYQRWGLGLEVANVPERRSQSGALAIRTSGFVPAAWGRYAFRVTDRYRTFVSLGGGRRLERVRTTFQNVVDVRNGRRDFVGLGLGVASEFYRYVLVEVEARVTSEEAAKFPGLALVARVGVTL